jgi:hypothetical protein
MAGIECVLAELKLEVASVAENRIGGVLAAAKVDGFGFRGLEFYWSDAASLVAAIAEGLACAAAAGTPEIAFSGFDFDRVWTLLGNGRF